MITPNDILSRSMGVDGLREPPVPRDVIVGGVRFSGVKIYFLD